jgi:hypothetical protein
VFLRAGGWRQLAPTGVADPPIPPPGHGGSPRVRWRLDREGRSSHGSEVALFCGAASACGGDGR